jgi:hypothetical protein
VRQHTKAVIHSYILKQLFLKVTKESVQTFRKWAMSYIKTGLRKQQISVTGTAALTPKPTLQEQELWK